MPPWRKCLLWMHYTASSALRPGAAFGSSKACRSPIFSWWKQRKQWQRQRRQTMHHGCPGTCCWCWVMLLQPSGSPAAA